MGLVKDKCDEALKIRDEIDRIYQECGQVGVAERLGISKGTVTHIIKFLGIKKKSLSDGLTKELLEELYERGGRKLIEKELGIKVNSQSSILNKFGIGNKKRVINYNNPLLKDSFEKWYLMGYILGDGSIDTKTSPTKRLTIISKDRDNLKKMADLFSEEIRIYPTNGSFGFSLGNNDIVNVLENWGIVDGKSFVGCSIGDVPKKYIGSFLLGLLDSDGYVGIPKGEKAPVVNWYGHISYMSKVRAFVESLGITTSLNYSRNSVWIVGVAKQEMIKTLFPILYANASFYLQRKYERFKVNL